MGDVAVESHDPQSATLTISAYCEQTISRLSILEIGGHDLGCGRPGYGSGFLDRSTSPRLAPEPRQIAARAASRNAWPVSCTALDVNENNGNDKAQTLRQIKNAG